MNRIVSRKRSEAQLASDNSTKVKEYVLTVAKFVPSEIISGYIAIHTFSLMAPENYQIWIWGINFLLCGLLLPKYFDLVSNEGDPVKTQKKVSLFAYVIWTYAIGTDQGLWGDMGLGLYEPWVASILLAVFTMFSGLFQPKAID